MDNKSIKLIDSNIFTSLKLIISFQLVIIGLIGLNFLNIHVPIVQEILFTIYLLFIPGLLVLRILMIRNININTLLYSIGISLCFVMFMGLILNYTGPYIGINNPLSYINIIFTVVTFTVVLIFISYFQDRKYQTSYNNPMTFKFSKTYFLTLLPFIAIIGSYFMNQYQNNLLLIALIIIVSLLPILVVFNVIKENHYPLTILTISTALVLHTSLISNHIWGYDLHYEFYTAKTVLANGYWNYSFNNIINAMLSITTLAPIYSVFTGLNLNWTFKILYPLIFSLVPLVLYQIYQNFTSKKISFLASFFFMSFFIFYGEMLQLARQEIAEFFLVLIMLLIFDKLNPSRKSFLCVLFSIALIMSHYSLSYIYVAMIIVSLIIIYLNDSKNRYFKHIDFHKYFKLKSYTRSSIVSLNYVILVLVVLVGWYFFTAGSTPINALTRIVGNMYSNIFADLFNSNTIQGLGLVTKQEVSVWYYILKYLNLILSFFVFVGVLSLFKVKMPAFYKFKEKILTLNIINSTYKMEYLGFILTAVILCIASISIPYFAMSLNVTRLYHITLLILSPFCIFGAIIAFDLLFKCFNVPGKLRNKNNYLKIMSLLLLVFFIFNSGLVFEVFHDNPSSIAISSNKDYPKFNEHEIIGVSWLSNHSISDKAYADSYSRFLLQEYGFKPIVIEGTTTDLGNHMIYLRSFNVVEDKLYYASSNNPILFNSSRVYPLIMKKNLIYSNGECEIYI